MDFYKYFLEALGREQDTISPEQALRSALVGEVATSDLKNATVNGTHLEQTEQEVQQGE